MQSILRPIVAAVLGIAGLVLTVLLLPLVLATILAIMLVAAGAIGFARWRLQKELGNEARRADAPGQQRQPARGRVIEADYEVIRER